MINDSQIKALNEDELSYLYYCLNTEWDSLNMGYSFDMYILKCFRNDSIQHLLNKYSSNLLDENKKIVMDILNKLEVNY